MTEDFMRMFRNRNVFGVKHEGTPLREFHCRENQFHAVLEIKTLSSCSFERVLLSKRRGEWKTTLSLGRYVGSLVSQKLAFFSMRDISAWRGVEYSHGSSQIVMKAIRGIYFDNVEFEPFGGRFACSVGHMFEKHQFNLYADDGKLSELCKVGQIKNTRDNYMFNPQFGMFDLEAIEAEYPGFTHDWNEFGHAPFYRIGEGGLDPKKLKIFNRTNWTDPAPKSVPHNSI